MPVVGDSYQQRERDQVLAFLEAELRREFGVDIDLTESSAFRTFAEAQSTVDTAEVEPAMEEVFDAAYLEDAEGALLDKVVAILGIQRRDATHATGTVEFRHGGLANQDFTIQNGTVVQTEGQGGIEFETTEGVTIYLLDDFEGGTLRSVFGGDRSNFPVVDGSASGDPSPVQGSYLLKSDGTNDARVYVTADRTHVGSQFGFHVHLQNSVSGNAVSGQMFGVVDGTNYYRTKVGDGGTHAIEIVTNSGTTPLVSSSPTIPPDEFLFNEIDWSPENGGTITSRIYDSNDSLLDEITVTQEDSIESGGFGFESLDGSENKYWDHCAMDRVTANVRARESGPSGNVGANTITSMPSIPSGVDDFTNEHPTGSDDHYLTSLVTYTPGRREETDEELRDRATVSEGARGEATAPALIASLSDLDGAESVEVFQNKEDSTDSDGRPPTSFEVVYFGTDPNSEVAETIFETKGFTAQDVGGHVGASVTHTVEAENGQRFDITWSEPTEVEVDMTLDVVVNDEWIGREALSDRIVQYVGGTLSDGTSTIGTVVGEDVYVDQIEDIVTGPDDTGVIGISSYSFTPSVTTNSNSLEVVSVGGSEVATTNAEDSSITINVTRV